MRTTDPSAKRTSANRTTSFAGDWAKLHEARARAPPRARTKGRHMDGLPSEESGKAWRGRRCLPSLAERCRRCRRPPRLGRLFIIPKECAERKANWEIANAQIPNRALAVEAS